MFFKPKRLEAMPEKKKKQQSQTFLKHLITVLKGCIIESLR